jgi:hypothetical protein
MAIYNEIDIAASPSGDMVLGSNKDLSLSKPSGCLIHDIMFRARTEKGDFEVHKDLGADLQSLIGEPNTRENAETAEGLLFESLTFDGRVNMQDLIVKGVPVSDTSLALYTFVNASNYDSDIFTVSVFDYLDGVVNTPGGGR